MVFAQNACIILNLSYLYVHRESFPGQQCSNFLGLWTGILFGAHLLIYLGIVSRHHADNTQQLTHCQRIYRRPYELARCSK